MLGARVPDNAQERRPLHSGLGVFTIFNPLMREAAARADAIESAAHDLNAVNPNRPANADTRMGAELIDVIEAKGHEVAATIPALPK